MTHDGQTPPALERWQASLADRYDGWAVVTGASDGIGRQMAGLLAAAGIDVVLVARREATLEAIAAELHAAHGVATLVVAVDLATPGGVATVLSATEHLDVALLVAAAGYGTAGAFLGQDVDTELDMIAVNVRAVTAITHDFGQRFVARGRGGIVLFGSLLGFQGAPGSATYAATKAFVQSFGEGLRRELAPHGVDVLVAAPGPVHTGFAARATMSMSSAADAEDVACATLRALGGRGTTVRPGGRAKLLGYGLGSLPRGLRVRMLQTIMASMTAGSSSVTLDPPSVTLDPPSVTPAQPSAAMDPPSVTPAQPSVALDPPSGTPGQPPVALDPSAAPGTGSPAHPAARR
jgi:uncharacterized protein